MEFVLFLESLTLLCTILMLYRIKVSLRNNDNMRLVPHKIHWDIKQLTLQHLSSVWRFKYSVDFITTK